MRSIPRLFGVFCSAKAPAAAGCERARPSRGFARLSSGCAQGKGCPESRSRVVPSGVPSFLAARNAKPPTSLARRIPRSPVFSASSAVQLAGTFACSKQPALLQHPPHHTLTRRIETPTPTLHHGRSLGDAGGACPLDMARGPLRHLRLHLIGLVDLPLGKVIRCCESARSIAWHFSYTPTGAAAD